MGTRRHEKSLRSDDTGVVYVEFLIAFMPIFAFFLGIIQLALLYPAQLVVEHAAYRAARTAVVVIDDDRRFYEGDARGNLGGAALNSANLQEGILRVGNATGVQTNTNLSRRATVELAAATVLAPLATEGEETVAGLFERTTVENAAQITVDALNVVFLADDAPSTTFGLNQKVTVRVEYEYRCGVPVVRNIVCPGGTHTLTADSTMTNQGARYPYPY